jgi:hypothetical protein
MSGETATSLQALDTAEDLASFITELWMRWDRDKEQAIDGWREVESYRYATSVSDLKYVENSFTHTTHIPVVSTIAQDLEAILLQVVMPHDDWFTYVPMDSFAARKDQRQAIVSYLKNRLSLNGYFEEVAKLRSDLVTYGNCFSQVIHVDESTDDKNGYVGFKVKRISPYDIAFDPTAANFMSTPKIIREVISLGELYKRGRNGTFDPDIVDRILKERTYSSTHDGNDDKNEQYVPRGFGTYQQYLTSGYVELLWFYGDIYDSFNNELYEHKMYVVADLEVLLYESDVPTPNGIPHIYHSVWEKLPDNLWGMGPLSNIIGMNYQINHRENSKSEGLDRTIYPDKVWLGDVEEMYDEDTGQLTYLAPEGGGVQDLPINTQFLNADLHIDRLNHAARQAARLPSDLVGFRSQGEKTLGEVAALTDGGMRGFIDKAGDFERTSLEQHLRAGIELAYENFGSAMKIPNQTDSGFIEMLTLTKEDLGVNGTLVPKGARRFARKNQLLASLTQVSATPLAQIAMTHISGKGAAHLIAELLEVQDTGLVEEFAQVLEAGEAQQVAQEEERRNAMVAGQSSIEEEMLNQELDGNPFEEEEDVQG